MATLQFDNNDLDLIVREMEDYEMPVTPENIEKIKEHLQQSLASQYYIEQEMKWLAEMDEIK